MTVRLLPAAVDDIDDTYTWLFERSVSAADAMRAPGRSVRRRVREAVCS